MNYLMTEHYYMTHFKSSFMFPFLNYNSKMLICSSNLELHVSNVTELYNLISFNHFSIPQINCADATSATSKGKKQLKATKFGVYSHKKAPVNNMEKNGLTCYLVHHSY